MDTTDAAREVCQRIAADSRRPEAERRLAAVGVAALQEDVLPPTTNELLSHIIDSLVSVENRVARIELTLARHNIRPIA